MLDGEVGVVGDGERVGALDDVGLLGSSGVDVAGFESAGVGVTAWVSLDSTV